MLLPYDLKTRAYIRCVVMKLGCGDVLISESDIRNILF